MRILITGATGYIGRPLVKVLSGAGHELVLTSRNACRTKQKGMDWRVVDFAELRSPDDWSELVKGVDVVINAVGIFTQTKTQSFEALHDEAPRALFEACKKAGVKRVVQISALGTHDGATSLYHRSKQRADDALQKNGVDWVILRPSLIVGEEGVSWQFFKALAALPMVPVIDDGRQPLQPISIDDVVKAIVLSIDQKEAVGCTINLVGDECLTLETYLQALSKWMGYPDFRPLHIPYWLSSPLAGAGQLIDDFPFNRAAVLMLKEARVYNSGDCREKLGFIPMGMGAFLAENPSIAMEHVEAKQYFLRPLLRLGLAFMWVMAGIVSIFFHPQGESLNLLARLGLSGPVGIMALYGAATLDILLGLALMARYQIRRVGMVQIMVIILYTLALGWIMPTMWADPFGALAKNIPIIIATLIMMSWSKERNRHV